MPFASIIRFSLGGIFGSALIAQHVAAAARSQARSKCAAEQIVQRPHLPDYAQ
jgi:hypothetical protein